MGRLLSFWPLSAHVAPWARPLWEVGYYCEVERRAPVRHLSRRRPKEKAAKVGALLYAARIYVFAVKDPDLFVGLCEQEKFGDNKHSPDSSNCRCLSTSGEESRVVSLIRLTEFDGQKRVTV